MLLGGLWHGASWSYAVWGGMHGLLLMLERLVFKDKLQQSRKSIIGTIYVFVAVTILWLLFKLSNFSYCVTYFVSLYKNIHIPFKLGMDQLAIIIYSIPVILYHLAYLLNSKPVFNRQLKKYDFAAYGLMLFMLLVNSGLQGNFIYFQF